MKIPNIERKNLQKMSHKIIPMTHTLISLNNHFSAIQHVNAFA